MTFQLAVQWYTIIIAVKIVIGNAQPGQTVKTCVQGHFRAFPHQEDYPKGPIRTSQEIQWI